MEQWGGTMEGLVIKGKNMKDLSYFKGKKVLVTGHTGFKGSWLCYILLQAGADVTGVSLQPSTTPNLFEYLKLSEHMNSKIGDISNLALLSRSFEQTKPEIVLHLAAQPLVRESYQNPVRTYQTNVMGTVNLLECIRKSNTVYSFLNVTTDKVYKNREWSWGYRENEELCGYDPYSNSKSCSELVTYSYQNSFFQDREIAISTARAGNVIGGGDFSIDRIVPDCFRAVSTGKNIIVRNPNSVRPYQHILEPLLAYLTIIAKQSENKNYAGNYNIGPDDVDCILTGELVNLFCSSWQKHTGKKAIWENQGNNGPHEANFLKLDCSEFKKKFSWKPLWHIDSAIDKAVEWYSAFHNQEDIKSVMEQQINEYIGGE